MRFSSPLLFWNNEPRSENVLVKLKMYCRVLNLLQLRRVGRSLSDDVEPILVAKVPRLLPLVGREADGPRVGAPTRWSVRQIAESHGLC